MEASVLFLCIRTVSSHAPNKEAKSGPLSAWLRFFQQPCQNPYLQDNLLPQWLHHEIVPLRFLPYNFLFWITSIIRRGFGDIKLGNLLRSWFRLQIYGWILKWYFNPNFFTKIYWYTLPRQALSFLIPLFCLILVVMEYGLWQISKRQRLMWNKC